MKGIKNKFEITQKHMENNKFKEIENTLLDKAKFRDPVKSIEDAPPCFGIYCIRIKNVDQLIEPCRIALKDRQHDIIYIGIANNLQKRLKQELIAKGHGTFFRSIGAILGFTPPRGSLKDKKNKYNYKFKKADENNIIQFNSDNLLVNYIITKERDEACEEYLIQKYRPIINIDKNPEVLSIVREKRELCREIANR